MQRLRMARRLDALEGVFDRPPFGFSEKDFDVAYTIYVRGIEITVFMHKLHVYVLLPDLDLEAKNIVIRAEKDILHEIREDFGREIKGISFLTSYVN